MLNTIMIKVTTTTTEVGNLLLPFRGELSAIYSVNEPCKHPSISIREEEGGRETD